MKKILSTSFCLINLLAFGNEATLYIYPKYGSEEFYLYCGKPLSKNIEIQDIDCKIVMYYEGHFYNVNLEHTQTCACQQVD